MPSLSYTGQSFAVDGRRLWLVAGSIDAARTSPGAWLARLGDLRDAGFNTVETACPWSVHEPRRNRYEFEGDAHIARFIELAGSLGLRVILRVGPFIGSAYDGGGIPAWLAIEEGVQFRVANDVFLDRFSRFLHRLWAQIGSMQATQGGPITLVQLEDGWSCGNEAEAARYFEALVRIARETGIQVPLLNANNLWVEGGDTVDTWSGQADLLANLRQLRALQPEAPRIVTIPAAPAPASGDAPEPPDPDRLLVQFAEALAAGAQPIIRPFHGGSNFGFIGGRSPHSPRPVTAAAAAFAPVGEGGAWSPALRRIRRLAMFASRFAPVFADLDAAYQPAALDLSLPASARTATEPSTGRTRRRANAKPAGDAPTSATTVIPLRGRGGQIVFLFGSPAPAGARLLLEDGTHLPVALGDQPVGWYLVDADLQGRGRLDYANLCPFALINQRILVLYGPAGMEAIVSLNGTPLHAAIPSGETPLILDHKGVRLVILNEAQVDACIVRDDHLVVGVDAGYDDASPQPAESWKHATIVRGEGEPQIVRSTTGRSRKSAGSPAAPGSAARRGAGRTARSAPPVQHGGWTCAPATDYADGTSARYATLAGPQPLAACGAPTGYGWYLATIRSGAVRTREVLAPVSGGRLRWYLNGQPVGIGGTGDDAGGEPLALRLGRGEHRLTSLVDNPGRPGEGGGVQEIIGLTQPLHEVKAIALKSQKVTEAPIDPFTARSFIEGLTRGQVSEPVQVAWSFTYARKAKILLEVTDLECPGTFVLNGVTIARYDGPRIGRRLSCILDPTTHPAIRGTKHVLRFAPDPGHTVDARKSAAQVRLYESAGEIGDGWCFARWEPPAATRFSADAAPAGTPAWWRTSFRVEDPSLPLWFDVKGLSRGVVLLNGRPLARYLAADANGREIGPQKRLLLPIDRIDLGDGNDLLVFDELGRSPASARFVADERGDLDA